MNYNPFDEILERLSRIEEALLTNNNNPVIGSKKTEIINRDELCKRLKITEATCISWDKKGRIPSLRFGKNIRYDWHSVIEALEEREAPKKPKTMKDVKLTEDDPFPVRNFKPREFNKKYVYIMRNKSNGRYKIGISQDPKFREKTLMSCEPDIELLHKWEGTIYDEQKIQAKYQNYKIRGEWFTLNEVQINEIVNFMATA